MDRKMGDQDQEQNGTKEELTDEQKQSHREFGTLYEEKWHTLC